MLPKKVFFAIIVISLLIYGGYVFDSETDDSTKISKRDPNIPLGFGLVFLIGAVGSIKEAVTGFK